jgi:hypothetical protein
MSDRPLKMAPGDAEEAGMDVQSFVDTAENIPPTLEAVPWLMLSHAEVVALDLNHLDGVLLSLIDGKTTVGALIDMVGEKMQRRDVLVRLAQWRAVGIVKLRETAPPVSRA